MPTRVLVYGATGYTGQLVVRQMLEQGMRPILSGRNPRKLESLARRYDLRFTAASLDDAKALRSALSDVDAVLHVAGPFATTAAPMLQACLATRTHYLDVSGEAESIEGLRTQHTQAQELGLMIMPGVGFDVVPSDCLAAYVSAALPTATHLYIGVGQLPFMTAGSAKSFLQYAGRPIQVRRNGALRGIRSGQSERVFDYGQGPRWSSAVSWGDVASAFYTTGIPNVETFFETNPQLRSILAGNRMFAPLLSTPLGQAWMRSMAELVHEPRQDSPQTATSVIVAEAKDDHGQRVVARLTTPEAYGFTASVATAIVQRVLGGDFERGFQTPARVYGKDFVLSFDGVVRERLES